MPFSHCFNCGNVKSPPFVEFYCDECEKLRLSARERATKNNLNPSEEARKALASRAFSTRDNRPDPRHPYTRYEATIDALNAINSRREGA